MGDAGSTILGFFVALLCVELSQGSQPACRPSRRCGSSPGRSSSSCGRRSAASMPAARPSSADNQHFHHVLTEAGFGVRMIFDIAIGLSLVFAAVGLALQRLGLPEAVSFALLAAAGIGTVYFVHHAKPLLRVVPPVYRRKNPSVAGDDLGGPNSG